MRVIAGTHRSRKLLMVDEETTRETKDRVKESIFNMIGPFQKIDNVLDLFAGSGSLGIEACSRGSKHVVFVEKSRKAVKTIHQNIDDLKIGQCSSVLQMDAFAYLGQTNTPFDLIFLDPPYDQVSIDDCLAAIEKETLLTDNGLIVVLVDQHTEIKETTQLKIEKQKRITRTNVVFLKWRN